MDVLTDVMCQLAEQANIPLSKLTVAVVSGTTAMESKAAGVDPAELQHDMEEGLEEFGRDVEYMLAGSNAIAVGNAYFTPCLTQSIGGDFLCSLLAADILQSDEPLLLINTEPRDEAGVVLAYGNKDTLSICSVPEGVSVEQGMARLLEVCEAECERIKHALVVGYSEVEVPSQLADRTSHVDNAAIEGASAVLLSELAEDELCRIASACRVVEL